MYTTIGSSDFGFVCMSFLYFERERISTKHDVRDFGEH